LKLLTAGLVLQQIFGAATYHSHWGANFMSEARGKGADRRKPIRVLTPEANTSLDKG